MKQPDLNRMSDEERKEYFASLSWEELIKLAGGGKRARHADGPAWKSLGNDRCHICHRQITDGESLKIKIGSSDCRPRIERETNQGSEMWEDISADELEIIWTQFNRYGVYMDDVAYQIKQVHRKGELVVFELSGVKKVLVKSGGQFQILSSEEARKLWRENE
jgi:hypothetical protein